MAELPATGSLGTGQLDTRDLLVAGVPISISSKYLYLYLELSGSTFVIYFLGHILTNAFAGTIDLERGARFSLDLWVTHRL